MDDLSAAYLRTGGQRCPFCPSEDLQTGTFRLGSGGADLHVQCVHCEREWHDRYLLTGMDVLGDAPESGGDADGWITTAFGYALDDGFDVAPKAELVLRVHESNKDRSADGTLLALREAVMGWREGLPLGTPMPQEDGTQLAVDYLIFELVNEGGFWDEALVSRMRAHGLVYLSGVADSPYEDDEEAEDEDEDVIEAREKTALLGDALEAGWVPHVLHFARRVDGSIVALAQLDLLTRECLSKEQVMAALIGAVTAWTSETAMDFGAIVMTDGKLSVGDLIEVVDFSDPELIESMAARGLCFVAGFVVDIDEAIDYDTVVDLWGMP